MSKYLWCEDSRSGYQFWRAIFHELYPDIMVESKQSNTGLRKAARRINPDEDNQYYLLIDVSMNNADVLRERKRLKDETEGKENVHIIDIHCFESALLSFEWLEQWVFAEKDDLRIQRQNHLDARAVFNKVNLFDSRGDDLALFKATFADYQRKNSEQIASRLLYEITRNTGFETDKSHVGECFINSCCEWEDRSEDDICGLDGRRINSAQKARILVDHSMLKKAFERI